jgi:hypothetical protein
MRHIVLLILAVATAYWLGPYAHTLTQTQRYIEMGAVFGFFFAIDLFVGAAKKQKKSSSSGSSYAYGSAKRK